MASIDERVVNMTFKSDTFLSGAAKVIDAVTRLKTSLGSLKGAEGALNGINNAGKSIQLGHIASAVDQVASRFSALGIAGTTALATIASKAVSAGLTMVKALTIAPIANGLSVYSSKLDAMQTILANTAGQQGSDIQHITAALTQLQKYADLTIYKFDDMTHAIGLFTAAGVDIKTSVASIKGLSNLAAMSGSSIQQAASAQYQLSQAIAAGNVKLEDWNSLVNAGMGGKAFQNLLIETARVNGVAIDSMIKKNGSFRLSLQEGWLTSKIMTQALSLLTGDLSKQQIMAMGFTAKQTDAIMAQAKVALDSAVKVRTVSQMWAAVTEGLGTAWATVWEALIGNLGEAQTLLTGVMNALSGMFVTPIKNLGTMLMQWKELGGRTVLIEALTNAFRFLGDVLKPIGQAFRDVFPAMTATRLFNMTLAFKAFVDRLKVGADTAQKLRSVFGGLFSAIKIVFDVISGVIGVIFHLGSAGTAAGGGILDLAAKFGRFLTNVRKSLESGNALANFFRILGNVLALPVKALGWLIQGFDVFVSAIGRALSALGPFISKVAKFFSSLGTAIVASIRSGDLSNVMNVLNQILLGGLLLTIRNFISKFTRSMGGGGILSTISKSFSTLTSSLKALQANINAGTLMKIGIAVALLAASIVALSFIDPARLTKSLTAMTVMFTELLGAMAVVVKLSTGAGIVKMGAVAAALNLLATAIVILSVAVSILSVFSWEQLAKGIGAIAAMLAILVISVNLLSANTKGVIASAAAMTVMAVALNLMAVAVRVLGGMDWASLGKGVGTVAALLAIMGAFNRLGGKGLISTAASILVLGAALNVMALAIRQLGSMGVSTLAKGLVAIAAGLVIIAFAMNMMPPGMILTATGLLAVSAALNLLALALNSMGNMSWGEIGKSLVALAGALVILAAAMIFMTGTLAGAAALLVVAGALAILTPVLMALGAMSWGSIAKGLIALAGAFAVIGVAGLLLAPVSVILLALGAAIALLGIGMLAAGVGITLFAAGMAALGVALSASGTAILTFVTGILNLLPLAMKKFGEGIVAFADAIAAGAPALIGAFSAILTALLQALIKNLPLILKVFDQLLAGFLGIIKKYAPQVITLIINLMLNLLSAIAAKTPQFVSRGADIIIKFLNGIAGKLPQIIAAGANIIIKFIQGIGSNMLKITQAAANTVINFVNGLANQIRTMAPQIGAAAGNLGRALVQGVISGITSMIPGLNSVLGGIGNALSSAWNWLTGSPSPYTIPVGESLIGGLAAGMMNSIPLIASAASKTANATIDTLKENLSDISADIGEVRPVITPVIDLSEVRRGLSGLNSVSSPQITIGTSMSAAAAAALSVKAPSEPVVIAGGSILTFTQNNTSPKALSAAEIYRQTKNQLSVMKGALPA